MKRKRILRIAALALFVCLLASVCAFAYSTDRDYNIHEGFHALPLSYSPDDSSSSYIWNGVSVTAYGGFIKGIQNGQGGDRLLIRALSPLPKVTAEVQDGAGHSLLIQIENINPDYYAPRVDKGLNPVRIAANALELTLNLIPGGNGQIDPGQPDETEDDNYVILGDSRDGYETFGTIIDQVNTLNPAFVIDNGDLVYSGRTNQYRVFDQMVTGIASTLLTTLGNHDIRGKGRETYVKLYGPEYYSFDFGGSHFVFLDSSRGYEESQAIPEEQYAWLERDLKKAQGKRIIVISHVPPTDPRSGLTPNDAKAYTDQVKKEGGLIEQKLEEHSDIESMNHGFQTREEAARFESLMSASKVDTVFLSHIHSYFDFVKDGVRYIISGGAGAELLTLNSYYHYLVAKTGASGTMTMVQLPSPPNLLLKRYAATASLFAKALYRENRIAVILLLTGLALFVLILLILLCLRFDHRLKKLWSLLKDTGKYMAKRYRELFPKKRRRPA